MTRAPTMDSREISECQRIMNDIRDIVYRLGGYDVCRTTRHLDAAVMRIEEAIAASTQAKGA